MEKVAHDVAYIFVLNISHLKCQKPNIKTRVSYSKDMEEFTENMGSCVVFSSMTSILQKLLQIHFHISLPRNGLTFRCLAIQAEHL